MEMRSGLCFLVLAISSICRGQNDTAVSTRNDTNKMEESTDVYNSAPPLTHDETQTVAIPPTSPNATDLLSTSFTTEEETKTTEEDTAKTNGGKDSGSAPQTTTSDRVLQSSTNGHVTSATTSSTPVIIEGKSTSLAYLILLFIIIVIVALCTILYFLRRLSRTYSFDLQRPVPVNNHEPTGTFEPVYLDDLDRPAPKDQVTTDDDLSPAPVANGTTPQSEEKGSNGENAPQEQPDTNGLGSSPTSITSLSLGDDPADKTSSPSNSTDLFFDAVEKEQQNENNNNPSICSSDPFVEISLDEPAWCDQLTHLF